MSVDRDALERVCEALTAAGELTLACHIGPDGDALGSMLGLAVAALSAGKKVWPTFGQPFDLAENYSFLPVDLLVPPGDVPAEPETLVAFDTGAPERLGELAGNAKRAARVVVIDHHLTNLGFGDVALVDPEASSTAELTMLILKRLGWPIDPTVATCLLTGIVTDTGRFQYSNTRPRTLQAASQLVAAGAHPEIIGQHIYEETPFGYLKVAAKVLERATLEPELSLVWSILELDDLKQAGVGKEDVDGLIDLVRLPREADVAALLKISEDETVKGSLRSRGRVDVGAIAADLGGGGHHNAAGFTFHGDPEAVLKAVRERLAGD
ncbi:MAG: bifunctional oligoribonuclease/PAP phosphatase NrnA [Acidimicrobiia bacterium]